MADVKSDPHHYLDEVRRNLEKMRAQPAVTPADNALFGMVDGLAGMMLYMLDQMADMRRRIESMEGGRG